MAESGSKRVKQLVTPVDFRSEHDADVIEYMRRRTEYIEGKVKEAKTAPDKKKFFQNLQLNAVVAVLKAYGKTDEQIAEWGCCAVAKSSDTDLKFMNGKFLYSGIYFDACKEVVGVLQAFGTKNDQVARWGCWAVGNLAAYHDGHHDFRKALVQAGACAVLMDVLRVFGTTDALVAEGACWAVGSLALDDIARSRLGTLGACELVEAVLRSLGYNHSLAAEWACRAVGNLSEKNDANRDQLFRAHTWISGVMMTFPENKELAEWGCYAIVQLARNNTRDKKIALGRNDGINNHNALERVVAALTRFGTSNAKMAEWGCRAVVILADDIVVNTESLGRAGACEAVMGALRAFGKTHEVVAGYGCTALGYLTLVTENAVRLGQAGACEVLVDVLRTTGRRNADLAGCGCAAIGDLAFNNAANTEKLGAAGACEAVVDVMRDFGANDHKMAWNGCYAVALLAENNTNKARLNALGAQAVVSSCRENAHISHALALLQ